MRIHFLFIAQSRGSATPNIEGASREKVSKRRKFLALRCIKISAGILLGSFFSIAAYAQTDVQISDTDFSKEVTQRQRLREASGQKEFGYRYNSYEEQKDLIFRQLEIITGDEETRYIIVPGDTMTISYDDRGTKQGAVYKVSSEGKVYLPLIGAMKVSGLNRSQARTIISEMFSQYIRHPNVGVTVNTSGRIMILGSVEAPGLYFLQPNLTVMEALLKAGSYDEDDANLKSILLMRGGTEVPVVKRLNLLKMIKKGDRSDDVLVKPGDLIYVPDKFVVNVEKFTEKVYRYVSAYYGLGRLPAPPTKENREIILWDR